MGFLQRALNTLLAQPAALIERLFVHGAALIGSLIYLYLWGFSRELPFEAFSQAIGIHLVAICGVRLWRSTEENEGERIADLAKIGLIFLGFQLLGKFFLLGELFLIPAIIVYSVLTQRYVGKVVASTEQDSPLWRIIHSLIVGIALAILNYQSMKEFDSNMLNIGVAALFAGAIFSKSSELVEAAKKAKAASVAPAA